MITTVKKAVHEYGLEFDGDEVALERRIMYTGEGFYSLADDGVYYAGASATYSRIKLIDIEG